MTKAKAPAPIAIDLEFEATSTALKNHAQKEQVKLVENHTIAFNLDEEFLKESKDKKADNVIDINNIAKTQKDDEKPNFKGFDISFDDLQSIDENHDKTQATMLLTAGHLKELEKLKKAETNNHKITEKVQNTDKVDSRIHIKEKPVGIKKIESKSKVVKGKIVDLNLLDNLEKVEGINPDSLMTASLSQNQVNVVENSNENKIVEEAEMNISEFETEENDNHLTLPIHEISTLEEKNEISTNMIVVEEKGNELELSEMSDEFEMMVGGESDQPEMQIESNIMNDLIQMDDLTQEFQINTEKSNFKTESLINNDEKESEGIFNAENQLDASLFAEEKESTESEFNFSQSEILTKSDIDDDHEFTLHEETKDFSLNDVLGKAQNEMHDEAQDEILDIFSLEEDNEPTSELEQSNKMPLIPEDALVTNKEAQETKIQFREETENQAEFHKQIQKYREDREKIIIEESNVGSMIRELREDRDRLLLQVSQLSSQFRENEQTLLTLRATLEESRIENSILKKRQNKEVEEARYFADVNEDRMRQAVEAAKIAEEKVVKLQQTIRIDFNQVKQREKELESKLELLMMDFDAQVKSRDQKILDLRRKLDSLEFNLETTNLREQKTIEEKKRIEDRLTKIMKTLKHSLHTLEDEVDATHANMVNKKR